MNRAVTPVLTPVLSARWALRGSHFMVCLGFVSLYLLVSYLPLFQSVVWRHVLVGDWILSHSELPQVDPFLPLSDGFRWVSTSWLSDILLATIWRLCGVTGLSIALAVVVLAMLILTGRACLLRSGHFRLAWLAMAVVVAEHWARLSILRPELFGLTCFAALLCLLARWPQTLESGSRKFWLITGGLFVLWANLDGSALVGVVFVAVLALGHALDVTLAERSLLAALRTPRVHRAFYLAEMAGVATLLQPQGFRLWTDVLRGERASAWTELGGASPLVLTSSAGWVVAAVSLLSAVLLRWSPRRVSGADVLLMLTSLLATAFNDQMTVWFAPLTLWVLLPHVGDFVESRSWFAPKSDQPLFAEGKPVPPLTFRFTVLSALAIWCAFALSPISNPLFGRGPLPLKRLVSQHAPQALTEFLKKSPAAPKGLVWVPELWGDWLVFDGPRGLRVSANSHWNLRSERQQLDIQQVHRGEGNWTRTLDRYGVELLVVDKQRQPRLLDAALAQGAEWSIPYEDDQALVLKRKTH